MPMKRSPQDILTLQKRGIVSMYPSPTNRRPASQVTLYTPSRIGLNQYTGTGTRTGTSSATILKYNADQGASFDWSGQTFTKDASLPNYSYVATITSMSGTVPSPGNLIAVSGGSSVTSIGNFTFYGDAALTTITMPSVTSIGTFALADSSLASVTMPLATSIGRGAFYRCITLTTVSMPLATIVGNAAFERCTSLASVTMPLVTYIDTSAFHDCSALTTISMPSVTYIAVGVFEQCTSLTSVTMPSVTRIETSAFYNCTSLTSVTIPASVEFIDTGAFNGSALRTVIIPYPNGLGKLSPATGVDFYGRTVATVLPN